MSVWRGLFAALLALFVLNAFLLDAYAQPATSLNTIQCIITGSAVSLGTCVADAIPLCLIGIGLSLLIVSLAYMGGEVLNYQPLKAFYRNQLWETIKSALIIIIIFSALMVASAIAVSFAGTAPTTTGGATAVTTNLASLYSTANSMYLTPQLNSSYHSLEALFGLSIGSEFLKSMNLEAYLPIPIPTEAGIIGSIQFGFETGFLQSNYITADAGGSFLKQVTGFTTSLVTSATALVVLVLFSFQIQSDLLYVIASIGLGILIPLGLVMRAIPFIRGIGGSLIAVGIGLSIVYPALLVGFNLPVSNFMYTLTAPTQSTTLTCPFSYQLLCKTLWSGATAFISGTSAYVGLFTGAIPITLLFGSSAATGPGVAASGNGFYTGLMGPFVNGIFPALNFVVDTSLNQIVQFLLFVIDIIIGVAITSAIANLLGGRLTLGVGRFKLA